MTLHYFPKIDDALVRRVDALLRSFVAEHRHRFLECDDLHTPSAMSAVGWEALRFGCLHLFEDGDAIRLEFVWAANEQSLVQRRNRPLIAHSEASQREAHTPEPEGYLVPPARKRCFVHCSRAVSNDHQIEPSEFLVLHIFGTRQLSRMGYPLDSVQGEGPAPQLAPGQDKQKAPPRETGLGG
jgi:hypothetical protein